MSEKLLIGWEEIDITPDMKKPVGLYGQYYARRCQGIHSRLKCTVCAMSKGDEMFVTGSLDNVGCPMEFHDMVRAEVVRQEPAIDPKKIFLNAIHTHCGPNIKPVLGSIQANWKSTGDEELSCNEYSAFAVERIAAGIVRAWKNRKPGKIQRAFGRATVGHCRRAVYANGLAEMYGDTTRPDFIGMEAGEDSGVEMLFTMDETGRKTGLFLNAACPSQVMESTYLMSSDFAGAVRELLKNDFGPDFRTIYQISPAGCQSPRDLVRHYASEPDFWHADGVTVLAERLRQAVLNPVEIYPEEADPLLKVTPIRITLPKRRASYADYRAAKAEVARLTAIMPKDKAFEDFCAETHANEAKNGPGPYDSKLHHFVLIENAEAVIRRYETQNKKPTISFDSVILRIGDAAMASNPFELYLYFGQIIKARSHAKQTFLVQLSIGADESAGYLPSPAAEQFGGYGGCIINGTAGSDGGYLLADRQAEAINALFE